MNLAGFVALLAISVGFLAAATGPFWLYLLGMASFETVALWYLAIGAVGVWL